MQLAKLVWFFFNIASIRAGVKFDSYWVLRFLRLRVKSRRGCLIFSANRIQKNKRGLTLNIISTPGSPRRSPGTPGAPKGPQGTPGDPSGPQVTSRNPGGSRGAQGISVDPSLHTNPHWVPPPPKKTLFLKKRAFSFLAWREREREREGGTRFCFARQVIYI